MATRYRVRFETTATVYTDFEVDADDEEDALKKARERCAEEGPSWEMGETDDDDVTETIDIVETSAQKRARWAEQRAKNASEKSRQHLHTAEEAVRNLENLLAEPRTPPKIIDEQTPTVGG